MLIGDVGVFVLNMSKNAKLLSCQAAGKGSSHCLALPCPTLPLALLVPHVVAHRSCPACGRSR